MVNIKIDISEKAYRIIQVKAEYDLKTLSEAIDLMAKQLIDKKWNEILDKDQFDNLENL